MESEADQEYLPEMSYERRRLAIWEWDGALRAWRPDGAELFGLGTPFDGGVPSRFADEPVPGWPMARA
jgi:hypothetical protein